MAVHAALQFCSSITIIYFQAILDCRKYTENNICHFGNVVDLKINTKNASYRNEEHQHLLSKMTCCDDFEIQMNLRYFVID
ncbi:hypothetical protein T11_15863 [Trichinella zimbabwensis]|uniref:Uncharacterized protein n=1 Tax=Trichinella zimbabwensis TaxID=268475 RepID=A0A0V1HXU2_9BILA|nr:hypothetical protein T11_15863 [Trichinella zimbabwensis]